MNDFEQLIISYLEGKLNQTEKALLLQQLESSLEYKKIFSQTKQAWDLANERNIIHAANTEHEWSKLKFAAQSRSKFTKRVISFMKYAAVFIVAMGSAYTFFLLNNTKNDANAELYQEIIVPKGQKSQVILADGTKIWLNSDTKLRYPANFFKGERKIYLEGEAYFNVAKYKKLPFIVNAGKIEISVMGTSFNVKHYPEDKKTETTLIEGRVILRKNDCDSINKKPFVLKPNQLAVYDECDHSVTITDLKNETAKKLKTDRPNAKEQKDVELPIAWKNEILFFNNESFQEIKLKMERWYGYSIEVRDSSIYLQRYKGQFEHFETINQVLEAIRLTTPIKYKIKDKTVIIEKI